MSNLCAPRFMFCPALALVSTLSMSLVSGCHGKVQAGGDDNQTVEPGDGQDDDGITDSNPDNDGSVGDDDDDDDGGNDSTDLGPGVKFDLDDNLTLGDLDPGTIGCQAIDFLFVVDNSGSMADEQMNLTRSFPAFMKGIRETLQARDYHIAVVDSDRSAPSMSQTCSGDDCTCTPAPDCCITLCESGVAKTCNDRPCDDLGDGPACDDVLGAGRVNSGDGQSCDIADNRRYMLQTQPNLDETFACLGRVGTMGDGKEQVMQAMINAVTDPLNAKNNCNDGFSRDDAVLVVVFMTDEEEKGEDNEDGGSPGNPQDWYNAILAAKGGEAKAVVMVGFFGDVDQPNAICEPLDAGTNTGAEASPRLRQFVDMFGEYGLAASICAEDYGPAFAEAVSIIDGACDDFPPK